MASALTTIDMEDFASDEVRAFQVEDRLHDVIDLTHMSDRVQAAEGGVSFFAVHRRFDDAGRYRVDPNAALGVLDGQRLGRRVDATLGQRSEHRRYAVNRVVD